jgi:dethiobiotin synthetase
VATLRFAPPVSPHLAAQLAGVEIEPAELVSAVEAAAAEADAVVVEGAGGLLVPLAPRYSMRGLARDLDLPLVIAAPPGLGTINHTLLTVEAARAADLEIAAVVLTPWPAQPAEVERSNRETIAAAAAVEVATLPLIESADSRALARAGNKLPLDRWLSLGLSDQIAA